MPQMLNTTPLARPSNTGSAVAFIAYIIIAVWLGFAAIEAFHNELECQDEDCIACFVIHSAQSVLIKIKATNIFQAIALIFISLLILAKISHIRPDTPILSKVRLNL
jgi:hypothetical protein